MSTFTALRWSALATIGLFIAQPAFAQEAEGEEEKKEDDGSVEVMTIKGTKQAGGESLLEAPVAVTAFGAEQLEAAQFRDTESLTFSIPNVSLDSVGTVKGVANFSIRGLGANSSIPSIDPTVGLFVNGIYQGSNAGSVLDTFDLESVEVLRGPQGVLFGRNVTGGAVLLQTRRPGDDFSFQFKSNLETGLEYRLYGGVDIPLVEDTILFRISGQWRDDAGYFTNQFPTSVDPATLQATTTEEQQFGEEEAFLVRPTLTLKPTDDLTIHVTYERGALDGEGPAAQSTLNAPSPGSFEDFDFSIDEPGFIEYDWDSVSLEATYEVGGNGVITELFGWRRVTSGGRSDIDASPVQQFHAGVTADIEIITNELRYSDSVWDERLDFTAGVYYFSQLINYREHRDLGGAAVIAGGIGAATPGLSDPDPAVQAASAAAIADLSAQLGADPDLALISNTMGGDQEQLALGAFSQVGFDVTDKLELVGGLRYTYETKDVGIATFNGVPGAPDTCGEELGANCRYDFFDDETWTDLSPKLGFNYMPRPGSVIYGSYTRGFRSGGYNLRNTSPTAAPGPFDPENQDAFELGAKGGLLDNKLILGGAGFFTKMSNLQREVNVPDAATGVVQIIQNTADAFVYGVEGEATVRPTKSLMVYGTFGITDANYFDVDFDLNGDGAIDAQDENLELPRLANITATAGFNYNIDLTTNGSIDLRGAYAYRDNSFFTDNNLGALPDGHVIDASISYNFASIGVGSGGLLPRVTVYGRNLLNEAFLGGQTPLPGDIAGVPLGGNFSPLKEGRVLGLELRLDYL
ncbi:MAG: TonB-dependent receptor [Myxococcota bacterium]